MLNLQSQGHGPWVVLSHALGCDLSMYDAVAANLAQDHHVLCYDHRGHGQSQTSDVAHSMNDLADDAANLIRKKCGGQPVVFAGVSMGGMTAQALAAQHPNLVRGIVVANSAQHYDEAARLVWRSRIQLVQNQGMQPILDGAMERWFSAAFRAENPKQVEKARAVLAACNPQDYARACQAVMHLDSRASNATVVCPALVIDGAFDAATPPALSDAIAQSLHNAATVTRASLQTGHLGATEDPLAFAELVRHFVRTLN